MRISGLSFSGGADFGLVVFLEVRISGLSFFWWCGYQAVSFFVVQTLGEISICLRLCACICQPVPSLDHLSACPCSRPLASLSLHLTTCACIFCHCSFQFVLAFDHLCLTTCACSRRTCQAWRAPAFLLRQALARSAFAARSAARWRGAPSRSMASST